MPNSNIVLKTLFAYGSSGYVTTKKTSQVETGWSFKDWKRSPNFRLARRNGGSLPSNAYLHEKMTKQVPTQTVSVSSSNLNVFEWGNWGIPNYYHYSIPIATHSKLYDKCIAKIPARLNGTQFSVPLFLKDLKQTVHMFERAANDLYTWYMVKRPLFLSKKGVIENSWLEYRMGWRLLLKDLYDALCAVHDRRMSGGMTARIKVTSTEDGSWTSIYGYGQSPMYTAGMSTADIRDVTVYNMGTTISLRMRDTSYRWLQPLQQFGITNPASTLWDALPLSFVLDWFFSVGDYLRTLDIFVGREFVSGSVGYWLDFNRKCTPVNIKPYGSWVLGTVNVPPTVIKERIYKRVPLTSFPVASLPHIDINLNTARVLDGIALVKQLSPILTSKLRSL